MDNIYYAVNEDEERWSHDDHDLAAFDYMEQADSVSVGEIITVYQGESKEKSGSDFLNDIAEKMIENAYDELGEHSEGWLNCDTSGLQDLIKNTVDKWCNETKNQPSFFAIENIKPVKLKVLFISEELDDIQCEIVV